ncbi:hypothetical protein [Owenweeksia hongkongensis]|uniref:hypothetical protein n=1 Tax=Owenweeksia hongkongensis TaxID=253245 RepID=UPI003A8E3F94
MLRLSTYILTIILMVGCESYRPPTTKDVLVDYADDLKHLMIQQEIDSVIWVLKSKHTFQYDFKQSDTVFKLYRNDNNTIYSEVIGDNNNLQIAIYDSIGFPIHMEYRRFNSKNEIEWKKQNQQILRIEHSNTESPDTTFYNFKNGRIESRLEKKDTINWEYASYSYYSSGKLKSIVDTMIYQLNHHYHKYEKGYVWNDSLIVQVDEIFTPGQKRSTFFDKNGFPQKVIEVFENGDTVIFEIIKF